MAKKVKAKTIGVLEFTKIFPDEETAVKYFETIRWGNKPTCPRCNQDDRITDCTRKDFRWCGYSISGTDREAMWNEIEQNIEKGSTLYTDDHGVYRGLDMSGYDHKVVNHSAKQYVDGMVHTNGVESVWAVLKRGYYGAYHNWSMKHTHRYVNEFTFRLNDGDVQRDAVDRIASLSQALYGKRLRYRELVA